MIVLFLIFWRSSILFSIVTAPIYIPPTVHKGYLFSTSSPTSVISCLFDNSHSNWREVIHFIVVSISEIMHLFIYLWATCLSSLEKCLFRLSAHFLIRLVLFLLLSSLYVLDINPLLDIQPANLFWWVAFSFCWWFPLLCRSFLLWYNPYLLIFAFVAFAFGVKSKKLLPTNHCKGTYCLWVLGILWFQILLSSL